MSDDKQQGDHRWYGNPRGNAGQRGGKMAAGPACPHWLKSNKRSMAPSDTCGTRGERKTASS